MTTVDRMPRPRLPLLSNTDTWLYVLTLSLLGIVVVQGTDLRRFTAALGVAVFGLLLHRVVGTWDRLSDMERLLTGLLALSPLVSALATTALIAQTGGSLPDNPFLWLVLGHRVVCIGVVVGWNRLLGRRPIRRHQRDVDPQTGEVDRHRLESLAA